VSDRSPEEREAARQERVRRRGQDAGGSAGPAPAGPPPPPATPPAVPPAQPPAGRPTGTVEPAAARYPGTGPPPARRRSPGRQALAFAGVVLVLGALAFVLLSTFQPFSGDGGAAVRVRIPPGLSAGQVGSLLADRGVVSSGLFFELRATLAGKRGALRSGVYSLSEDMSNGAALDALTGAAGAAPVISVVIPEGPSRREVAPLVARQGVRGSYLEASTSSRELKPRRYGAPSSVRSLEGFLFPATYELLRRRPDAAALVTKQLRAFKANFRTVDLSYARSKNLTAYDILIIASMIERETSVAPERRLVAAVIYNRLRKSIPLGIDASTRYAAGNWTRPLTGSELRSESPYNTRNRQGLPPGPIGNPGLASIKAAARPASVDYLYYVVAPCKGGAHAFSTTDAEFQQDVAAYNAKRAELGGRDPKECPK